METWQKRGGTLEQSAATFGTSVRGRIKTSFGTYYLPLSKSQAAVPGGRNAISTPAQSPAR
ncbi:MAG: hypothetical protein ABIO55_07205 [Ginsengibacter sp.]